MAQSVVRISESARGLLRRLSEAEGRSMQAVLQSALELYRRQRFLEEVNASYAALRRDAGSWESWQAEWSQWDATLGDGLARESEPRYRARRRIRARKGR